VGLTAGAILLGLLSALRWLGMSALIYCWLFAAGVSWFGKIRPTEGAVAPAE
jgi:hypothetical protein